MTKLLFVLSFLFSLNILAYADCEWDMTTYRRILHGSGCTDEGTRICSGYVVCKTDGVETTKLATCSVSNCSKGKASACVAEKGYASKTPTDVSTTSTTTNTSPGGTNQ